MLRPVGQVDVHVAVPTLLRPARQKGMEKSTWRSGLSWRSVHVVIWPREPNCARQAYLVIRSNWWWLRLIIHMWHVTLRIRGSSPKSTWNPSAATPASDNHTSQCETHVRHALVEEGEGGVPIRSICVAQ